jgi:hypothetical protein
LGGFGGEALAFEFCGEALAGLFGPGDKFEGGAFGLEAFTGVLEGLEGFFVEFFLGEGEGFLGEVVPS